MLRDIDQVEFPDWMSKDRLIPAIFELTPIDFVYQRSALIRACYNTDKYHGWDEERLEAMSEFDLIRIYRLASLTDDDIPNDF